MLNPNIFAALDILIHKDYFNLSQRKINVSTVGIVPGIEKLVQKFPHLNVAFSLHSPFEDDREKIMPITKSYSIKSVMETLDVHCKLNKRKVFLSYTMMKDVNDTDEHLNKLIDLIKSRGELGKYYHVNLIRYNATVGVNEEFQSTNNNTIYRFYKKLIANGINSSIRHSFGTEINAACG